MKGVIQLYRSQGAGNIKGCQEICFNVGFVEPLTDAEINRLRLVLADGFKLSTVTLSSVLRMDTYRKRIVELGPRLNVATPWSSNMVSICRATGLEKVIRVERSRLYAVQEGIDEKEFIAAHHDRMTECLYPQTLPTFEIGISPEEVYEVDLIGGGPDALKSIPGISMDEWDRNFYYDYFVKQCGRNPTIVEIMDLNNANSEHSRHGYFRGKMVINGVEMPETLMDIVKSTLGPNTNSIIAFCDNSSGIEGRLISTIIPDSPGKPSGYVVQNDYYHIIFTAETHNFPTGIAPFPGAETGTGGRIRDIQGTGRGGLVVAGTAGYCVGNLHIPNYKMPWEIESNRPDNLASPLQIEIGASDGASRYGNEFGEPVTQGFTRSFDLRLSDGERWGFLKPIMFTGGIGQIPDCNVRKGEAKKGMLIVQIGGPAYRVGFGGGAASSLIQGDQDKNLDFNAVQRGDAEMEQKMNRVIRACVEMGEDSPIITIHDQGAGGPANVLKELVEKAGGTIDMRKINVGDPTMSVLEIWVAEFQERNGVLVYQEWIEEFKAICEREKVNCEVLGEVTGDGVFTVVDSNNGTHPVKLDLGKVLGGMPQKTFIDSAVVTKHEPLRLPKNLTVIEALDRVFRLVSVGSKKFLTNKVDRSVTGLIVKQQCCGPLQMTVGDVAVIAQSHFTNAEGKYSGAATAIGEQPIKMLVNPAAGARMAVGEALTNLVGAKIDGLDSVKCSANWMWAPKLPGEGAAMYAAATAMRNVMIDLGIAVDGGKDSLSMATRVPLPDGKMETVKSPRQLVISAYATMADVTNVVTPDIKRPGESALIFIDLAHFKNRLGGSALAQVFGQIGDECPDMDDPLIVLWAFSAVQELIERDLICACHDRSDGGLVTTMLEMVMSGNCGIDIQLPGLSNVMATLFSEELGLVIECLEEDYNQVKEVLKAEGVHWYLIGRTLKEKKVKIYYGQDCLLEESLSTLRNIYEATSFELECLQANASCVSEERKVVEEMNSPSYGLSFVPKKTSIDVLMNPNKPKVAILREEGSNGDREMASAFFLAGFEPWDMTMTDLLSGKVGLGIFRGLAAVGGFSYADVAGSAKGWASTIMFNEKLRVMFDEFYARPDTFSLGVCNGCQLFGLLGWVPWRGIIPEDQPRFVSNDSGRFESRWSMVRVLKSPSIMLKGMEELIFGIHVDHGEGKLVFPDQEIWNIVMNQFLAPMVYVDDEGNITEKYPFNPNGSHAGVTALCSPDGRHLAMMPHPERAFLPWQCHYLPEDIKQTLGKVGVSPWFKMFQNAYEWCLENR